MNYIKYLNLPKTRLPFPVTIIVFKIVLSRAILNFYRHTDTVLKQKPRGGRFGAAYRAFLLRLDSIRLSGLSC